MNTQFLSRVLPVLPLPGPFGETSCYFALNLGSNTAPDQRPCSNHASIRSHGLTGVNLGLNAYVALASFKSPLSGRKRVNADSCRAIWADIDCGEGKPYPDDAYGLVALLKFAKTTGLIPTVIVSSGRGIHAYWTFRRNVKAEPWTQVAEYFYQLCKQENLQVDPARARDVASVMRLPGTVHQKTGKIVTVIHDSGTNYDPKEFLVSVLKNLKNPVAPIVATSGVQQNNNDLAKLFGMGPKPPTADAFKIAKNCAQIRHMGHAPYPAWFGAMSVLRRCKQGLEWAQGLSALDKARYNPVDTEKKFYEANEDAPVKCFTLDAANPGVCRNCQYWGKIVTPVQLNNISEPPAPQPQPQPAPQPALMQPTLIPQNSAAAAVINGQDQKPTGAYQPLVMLDKSTPNQPAYIPLNSQQYRVDHRGVIWLQTSQDANKNWVTTEHVMTSVQLWFKYTAHREENGVHCTIHYFDAIFPNGKVREIKIVAGDDMTEYGIMRLLHSADITPKGTAFNGRVFMGFFNAYLDSVMNIKKIVPIVKEFGWTKFDDPVLKQNVPGFVIGNGVITESGMHPVGVDSGTTGIYADRAFAHAGKLEEWKHVPRMYMTLKQQMSIFALCCSLASPFMKYGIAEAKNSYVNLYSPEGGKGKSTLLRAAHSIWGNPQYAFGSPAASVSQRGKAMSVWNNLPYFVDEITRMKDEDMNHMVYTLAGGMDKDRLKSNADLTMTGQWSMFTMSTANRSIKEALAKYSGDTDATLLRVTEYECDFPNYDGQPEIQAYIRAVIDVMEKNYGVAGPEFMYQVMKHPERLVTLRSLVDNWRIRHGFKDSERFLAFSVGIPLHIGRWAVEWGIFDFDIDALEKWVLEVLVPFNRQGTEELAPDFVNNMMVYLNNRLPSMLQVKRDKRAGNEPDGLRPGMFDKYIVRYPQNSEITSRYEHENDTLYISSADFKRWCDGINISPLTMSKNLAANGIYLEPCRVNLGAYVSWLPTSRMRCYAIRSEGLRKLGWKPSPVEEIPEPPATNLDALNAGTRRLPNGSESSGSRRMKPRVSVGFNF